MRRTGKRSLKVTIEKRTIIVIGDSQLQRHGLNKTLERYAQGVVRCFTRPGANIYNVRVDIEGMARRERPGVYFLVIVGEQCVP